MKIYEKPMATIEKLDVMDVITSSDPVNKTETGLSNAITASGVAGETIVFQW
ncbi:MAG: hypothetical protein SOZ34_07215 [Clostridia bacterium]|nr:hypothetical protein [Clostridia bacterium]